MSFRASSSTQGPYAGQFSKSGEIVMRRTPEFEVAVVAARAEFTISSPTGQVSGTKHLVSHVPGDSGATDCADPVGLHTEQPIQMSYTATITSPDGVFSDRGSSTMDFEDTAVSFPTTFDERFTSSLSGVEQEHSVLFGKRTAGSSFSAMSANTKRASPFVFYFPGTVRRIHAFIDGRGATSGSQKVRAVLYRRDATTGGPGPYVARSFEYTVPAGMSARWVPFWLSSAPRVEPGVYWLALQTAGSNGIARYAWDPVPGSRRYNVDAYADGPTDSFGAGFGDDQQMSIFAFGSY